MKNWIYLGAWAAAFGGLFYMMSNDSSTSLLNDVINASSEVVKVVPIKNTSWKPLYDPTINWETKNNKDIHEVIAKNEALAKRYYDREKTLAEQVFNYIFYADVKGSLRDYGYIVQEKEKCVVSVLNMNLNTNYDQMINEEKYDITQINPKDWLYKPNYHALFIGNNKKFMLHSNVERQRLENGWVKLFEQCPYKGPKSAF